MELYNHTIHTRVGVTMSHDHGYHKHHLNRYTIIHISQINHAPMQPHIMKSVRHGRTYAIKIISA
jgi:hypothetical protein